MEAGDLELDTPINLTIILILGGVIAGVVTIIYGYPFLGEYFERRAHKSFSEHILIFSFDIP